MVTIGALTRLLQQYEELKQDVTPTEFVEIKRATGCLPADIAKNFLVLGRHYQFLEQITKNFVNSHKIRHYKEPLIMVIVYTIIFHVCEDNYDYWFSLFAKWNSKNVMMLLEYFSEEENLSEVAMVGCKVFCDNYVVTEIIRPLVNKVPIIKQLHADLMASVSIKSIQSPVAGKGPSLLYRPKHSPPPPLNTPVESPIAFKSSEVPYHLYQEKNIIERMLQRKFNQNRKRAKELLQRTKDEAFACSTIKEHKEIKEDTLTSFTISKFKKPPLRKNVDIKTNAATIMREAAFLARKEEQEIQKLESLMQGGRDDYKISALEVDIRNAIEEERLKDIERKHLLGQLTYEEAILARKKWFKENREKAAQFKEERNKIFDDIEKWRLGEQEKIKQLIDKCQIADKCAKEAQERLLVKRQRSAKLFKDENRKLLNDALHKKQMELKQKVQLIQELRALQQVRNLQVYTKEFDPTETKNLGLLCEMSIAELQERLGLLKLQMHQDLEDKRKKIIDLKEKKCKLLEDTRVFVSTAKSQSRVSLSPKLIKPTTEYPEIMELREKLQRAREMRFAEM